MSKSNLDKMFEMLLGSKDSDDLKEIESFKFSVSLERDLLKRLDFLVKYFDQKRSSFVASIVESAIYDLESKLGLDFPPFVDDENGQIKLNDNLTPFQLNWMKEVELVKFGAHRVQYIHKDDHLLAIIDGQEFKLPRDEEEEKKLKG